MVLRRQYSLEENVSGRDLDFDVPLHFVLRRGMKINMSMIFDVPQAVSRACPRCGVATIADPDASIHW